MLARQHVTAALVLACMLFAVEVAEADIFLVRVVPSSNYQPQKGFNCRANLETNRPHFVKIQGPF